MPIKTMQVSERGLALIKKHEGFIPHTYDDFDPKARPVLPGQPVRGTLTIGYGETDPKVAKIGATITEPEAAELLSRRVAWFARQVERALTRPVNQNQFDALVSLTYNIGPANFRRSLLLRRWNNMYPVDFAAEGFMSWVSSKGKRLPGLERRRREERALFLTPPEALA